MKKNKKKVTPHKFKYVPPPRIMPQLIDLADISIKIPLTPTDSYVPPARIVDKLSQGKSITLQDIKEINKIAKSKIKK